MSAGEKKAAPQGAAARASDNGPKSNRHPHKVQHVSEVLVRVLSQMRPALEEAFWNAAEIAAKEQTRRANEEASQ